MGNEDSNKCNNEGNREDNSREDEDNEYGEMMQCRIKPEGIITHRSNEEWRETNTRYLCYDDLHSIKEQLDYHYISLFWVIE